VAESTAYFENGYGRKKHACQCGAGIPATCLSMKAQPGEEQMFGTGGALACKSKEIAFAKFVLNIMVKNLIHFQLYVLIFYRTGWSR
jgi:hypothetical protein